MIVMQSPATGNQTTHIPSLITNIYSILFALLVKGMIESKGYTNDLQQFNRSKKIGFPFVF